MVPDRADTWTRMSYAGPNKPIAPIDDPYQMFAKLYGRMKDQESLRSILDDLQEDFKKVRAASSAPRTASCSRSTRRSSARWSRSSRPTPSPGDRPCGAAIGAGRQRRKRQHAATQQAADRPDGEQLRGRLRPRRHAAIHKLGRPGPHDIGSASTKAITTLARAGQQRRRPARS